MSAITLETANESQTEALGRRLASSLPRVRLIYLRGPLGAGKTTLVRGLLHALGHEGAVKSPTFTLIEPYTFSWGELQHFDLYRLERPEEVEFLALRDQLHPGNVCVVEWPERGGALLPVPDLDVMMQPNNNQGRNVQLQAHSQIGEAVLREWR